MSHVAFVRRQRQWNEGEPATQGQMHDEQQQLTLLTQILLSD